MVRQHRRSHPEDGPLTVLVEFTLTRPDNVTSVASTVADAIAENLSWRPGFLSATTMVSADAHRLVAVVRWAGQDAWQAAKDGPDGTTVCAHGDRDLHWLHTRDRNEPLLDRLVEAGATVRRVQALHELQTLVSLSPRPAPTTAPRSRRTPADGPATANGGLLRTRPHNLRTNPRSPS